MSSITYATGQFTGHARFIGSGFIAPLVAKWQDYRTMRELESVPYNVMKDIGFRAAERTNAQ